MKKLIGLVVILAALVLGGYYGMGVITERTLKRNAEMINQSNGLYVDIKQYDRGWFTSDAQIHWRLHVPERVVKGDDGQSKTIPPQDYNLDMPLKIHHGPIAFADSSVKFGLGYAQTNIVLPKEYAEQFDSVFTQESIKPVLKISVLVDYINRSKLRVEVPDFKLIAKDGSGNLEWLGLTNDVTVSSNLGTIKGDLTVEGIKFAKDTTKATVGEVTSEYNLKETKEGLYTGDANFLVPSIVVEDKGAKVFELEKFETTTSTDIDGGLLHTYFETSLEKVIANSKNYGPGLLKLSLKNLDANVLAKMNQQVNQIQNGTDSQRQQAMMAILPELPKLFSQGAEFRISELSFVMPEGKLEGNVLVALPKGEITNPFQLIQRVQGEGKLKVPAVIVKHLIRESVKQQLKQSGLQQAMVEQIGKNQTATDPNATPAQANQAGAQDANANTASTANAQVPANAQTPASSAQGSTPDAANQGTVTTTTTTTATQQSPADIEQMADTQAEQKLNNLIQSGLFTAQGSDYVVEFKLANGQLTVNGQPFNPSSVKF